MGVLDVEVVVIVVVVDVPRTTQDHGVRYSSALPPKHGD